MRRGLRVVSVGLSALFAWGTNTGATARDLTGNDGPPALQAATRPGAQLMDSKTVTVLTGLTVPEFEAEMQYFVQALGVSCGYCHVRQNFASDDNPKKLVARRMIAMAKGINQQYFPDYAPSGDDSRLGKVSCYTCHQGEATPKRPGQ